MALEPRSANANRDARYFFTANLIYADAKGVLGAVYPLALESFPRLNEQATSAPLRQIGIFDLRDDYGVFCIFKIQFQGGGYYCRGRNLCFKGDLPEALPHLVVQGHRDGPIFRLRSHEGIYTAMACVPVMSDEQGHTGPGCPLREL
jgi:hypothetical protein